MDCLINCTGDIPARYDIDNCAPVFRKFGYNGFVAFKCGLEFTDMLDTTEWETKITAGDIILSPSFGTFTLGETSTTTIPGGCGEEYPEFSETPWTFTTPSTSDDYTDEDFWYFFSRYANGYTMGYLNCDGRLYLDDASITIIKAAQVAVSTAAVTGPGLTISLTNKPSWKEGPNGVGKAGIWSVAGKFIHDETFRSVEIPGLTASLQTDPTP